VPSQCRSCAICGYEWPRPEPLDGETIDPEPGEGEAPKQRGELSSFILTEVDLLAATPFRYEHIFDGVVSIASAMDAWGLIVSYQGRWHAIGGGNAIGIRHLADTHDRLLAMATADDFLREHGDASAANKGKRWMSEPPTDKQLQVLGMAPMQAMGAGVNKYRAACLMTWKFNERAVRGIVERSKQRMAA
jgi:hypothetical protein